MQRLIASQVSNDASIRSRRQTGKKEMTRNPSTLIGFSILTRRRIINPTRSGNTLMAEDAAEFGGSESARLYYFDPTDHRGRRRSYVIRRTMSRSSSYTWNPVQQDGP